MSYLKLGQIVYQGNPDVHGNAQTIYYEEDCMGNVLVNSFSYPLTVSCEVFDWSSQANFEVRGTLSSAAYPSIAVSSAPGSGSLREAIFSQLVSTYPTLVI